MAQKIIGVVSSDKRDKTITVTVASRETHPLYRKQYTKTRKYTAHDEKNEAAAGDRVEIEACRPYSKTVSYNLVRIIEKGKGKIELKEEEVIPEKEAKMTEQRSEDAETQSVSPSSEAVRTDSDSEGGKV
ncbi:30S ribosomal protein S17 [Candidatus Saccharibacteria bacterium]|nr:30S ribosomal protein S17 [Candidatus Saccharibacteria bacterium]